MRTRKKKLMMKTVIHRARLWLKHDRNRDGAVLTVFTYTDYSLAEAERFVDFILQFTECDQFVASCWCDEHRRSKHECKNQHPQDMREQTTSPPNAVPPPMPISRCLCGNALCNNQWHDLATWIGHNPQQWQEVLNRLFSN